MNPSSFSHLNFDKGAKNIWWRKGRLFNKCCWEKWSFACRKLKLVPCLSPCTSINSKRIKDLNIRSENLSLVQKRAGNTQEATEDICKYFLCRIQVDQHLKERIDKWAYKKLKIFWTTKEKISKLKRPPTEWEKIFASYTLDKGLITRI
jgi:hypothetical protein